jgi:hypothetical protein
MRIWVVPLNELSDQHILGQHQEWHMLEAMMRNTQFVRHPLVKFFRNHKAWLHKFHLDLVFEMWCRFKVTAPANHLSPSPFGSEWREYLLSNFHSPKIEWPLSWVAYDREDLRRRSLERKKLTFKKTSAPEWWGKESDLAIPLGPIPLHSFASPETFGSYTYEGVPLIG